MLLFLFVLFCFSTAQMSIETFNAIANTLVNILADREANVDLPQNGRRPGDTPAGWLRLSFHDAGSYDPSQSNPQLRGGAHACMFIQCATDSGLCEREAVDNRGLKEVVDDLEIFYQSPNLGLPQPISALMSRADFWQLAGKIAVEFCSGFQLILPFSLGRRDWETMFPGTLPRFEHRLPHPTDTPAQLQSTFFRMGFTSWTDIVALLGAHALGRSRAQNIGYHGKWVPGDAKVFSNVYYQTLIGPSNAPHRWFLQTVPGGQPQYLLPEEIGSTITDTTIMMLPADIAIFWFTDRNGINPGCNVTLQADSCPLNPTSDTIVERFANSQSEFFAAFASAYSRMQNLGGDQLTPIFGSNPPSPSPTTPTPTPTPTTPSPSPTPTPTPSGKEPSGKNTQGKTPAPSGKNTGGKNTSGGKSGKSSWSYT